MSKTSQTSPPATLPPPVPQRRRRRLYEAAPEAVPPASTTASDAATQPAIQPAVAAPAGAPARSHLPQSPLLRRLKADQAVRDHALLAAGAMVIPVPLLDMAAEAAIQVRMVKRLAEIHGVDFAEERAKALVAAALGGFSAGWAAGSLLRYASFATYFANFWPSALLSSAITYGIGHVFIQHFEKGGNLHDLAPESAARFLREKARSLRP